MLCMSPPNSQQPCDPDPVSAALPGAFNAPRGQMPPSQPAQPGWRDTLERFGMLRRLAGAPSPVWLVAAPLIQACVGSATIHARCFVGGSNG